MTRHPLRPPFVLVLLLASLLPTARAGEGETVSEDDVWVAKVGERTLLRSRLADTVGWRMRSRLEEPGSGPTTILRQMVEERAVLQEARRLGVAVAEADVERAFDLLDRELRQKAGGNKTLSDEIRNQGTTLAEFRQNLRHQLLKERIAAHPSNLGATLPTDPQRRIAQTEVVITEVLKRTDVKYGWKTALQEAPTPMAPEVVATVNGEPITMREYGEELLDRLPSAEIRQIIAEECKAALTSAVALSVEAMTKVVEEEQARWNTWREMTTQEAYRNLPYDEYVKMRYRLDLDQMRQDRYFRGLFGLIQQEKAKIAAAEVEKEWQENKEGLYGDAILVTDVEIAFAPQNPLLGDRGGRSRKDALQMANDLLRRQAAGLPFEQIVREVNAARDPTFRARKLRVRNTATGRLLFERAREMKDQDLSRPFETLSEVHVLRREQFLPAPAFEEVRDMILEGMAQRRAHDWLEAQVEDPAQVQIRWPLP